MVKVSPAKADKDKPMTAEEMVEATEARLAAMENEHKCFLNREQEGAIFLEYWDTYILVLLVFTAVVTPYQVAYLEPAFNALFYFDRLIDFSFLVDMVLQFFLVFYDDERMSWVYNHKIIAKEYLKFWFWVDLVSIVPFDIFSLVIEGGGIFLVYLRVLRCFRLLRLFKLMKLLQSRQYSIVLGMSYTVKEMLKFLLIILMMAHLSACAWGLTGMLTYDDKDGWIWGYGIQDSDPIEMYVAAFYWAIMTLGTMGYGDIVAANTTEMVVAIFVMLAGGAVYAYVTGCVFELVTAMNQDAVEYRAMVDQLNSYLESVAAPPGLRLNLRTYFHNCRPLFKDKYFHEVLQQMSPGLRHQFAACCHGSWIKSIYFFVGGDNEDAFISSIALSLRRAGYPAGELLISMGEMGEQMYIVRRGLVGAHGRVRRVGDIIGEDVVLATRRFYTATCLTFVDTMILDGSALSEILDDPDFRDQYQMIRKASNWLLMRYRFEDVAKGLKMQRKSKKPLPVFKSFQETWDYIQLIVRGKIKPQTQNEWIKTKKELKIQNSPVREATPDDFKTDRPEYVEWVQAEVQRWMGEQDKQVTKTVRNFFYKSNSEMVKNFDLLLEGVPDRLAKELVRPTVFLLWAGGMLFTSVCTALGVYIAIAA